MKLFLAFALPDDVRTALLEATESLRTGITRQGVRLVKPEKWHVTLLYIGDLDDPTALLAELKDFFAGRKLSALPISLTTFDGFPGIQRPRVVFARAVADFQETYWELATSLEKFCQTPPEPEWIGHVTLARVSPGSKAVGYIVKSHAGMFKHIAEWTAGEVVLLESLTEGDYRVVESFAIG